jgi:hypothetical protein
VVYRYTLLLVEDDKDRATRDTQSYTADALQNMSLQDRDQLYHEVHGVEEVIDETPEPFWNDPSNYW